ncbi:MAG TPA: SH3 domain-containing protein [Planktothrix sp.]|jgi:uncharacterized protein YraI
MRCPECSTRNSVAANLCFDCGHKFKRKPVPLPVKATIGISLGGFVLWGVAMALVPSFIDAGNSLTRTAKHVAAGPSSAADAVKMHNDLDVAVRKYLKEIGNEKTPQLAMKLQQNLHSTAYEVHAFDLPRRLKLVEVDTGLNACDYLLMPDQNTVKIFPIPGLEVFDGGKVISESGAPTLVLVGHTGYGVPHPQVKVMALLPGDIADETEKAVPAMKGEGKPQFARNNKDIYVPLSLWSLGTAQGLFKNPPNVVARQDDDTIRLALEWKDGHYRPTANIGSSPLAAVYAVAWAIKTPGPNPFSSYLGDNGVQFAKQYQAQKPGVSPMFIVEQLSSGSTVTTSRHHHRHASAGTSSYLLNGVDAAYRVDLINDGNKWVFNAGKHLTDDEVKVAEAQSKSSDITAPNAAPATLTAGSAPAAKIVVQQVDANGKTSDTAAKIATTPGADASALAAASTANGTRKAFSAATSGQNNIQPVAAVPQQQKTNNVATQKVAAAPITVKQATAPAPGLKQIVLPTMPASKQVAAASVAETKKSTKVDRHSKKQIASAANNGTFEGAAIDALANRAESKARAWLDANPDGGSAKPAATAPVPGKSEAAPSKSTSKVTTAAPTATTTSKSATSTASASTSKSATTASKSASSSTSSSKSSMTASSSNAGQLSSASVGQTIEVTDQVKLRRGPATEYRQIGEIPKGSKLEVIGKKNGWYQVRSNGQEGYVYGALASAKSDSYTTATVKQLASIDGAKSAKAGDKVVVLGGIKDGKYKVQLANGKVASVPKEAIDVKVDAPDFVP